MKEKENAETCFENIRNLKKEKLSAGNVLYIYIMKALSTQEGYFVWCVTNGNNTNEEDTPLAVTD